MALQFFCTFLIIYGYWIVTALQEFCMKTVQPDGKMITGIVRVSIMISAIGAVWGL